MAKIFICYLPVPWPLMGHYPGENLTYLMLIMAFSQLMGFELGTFQFNLNALK